MRSHAAGNLRSHHHGTVRGSLLAARSPSRSPPVRRNSPRSVTCIHRFLLYALLLKSCCLLISDGTTATVRKISTLLSLLQQLARKAMRGGVVPGFAERTPRAETVEISCYRNWQSARSGAPTRRLCREARTSAAAALGASAYDRNGSRLEEREP
jgi:hypothetical protein